jgi:hypothetical protein
MMRAAIATPSPVPDSFVVKNGSNSRFSATSRITTSVVRSESRFVSTRTLGVMAPFRPMLSAAFWIRLTIKPIARTNATSLNLMPPLISAEKFKSGSPTIRVPFRRRQHPVWLPVKVRQG